MKASKFPVTFKGEQFRVSVAIEEESFTRAKKHRVKVYVVRTGLFSAVMRYRRVLNETFRVDENDLNDVIASAQAAVKYYIAKRKDRTKLAAETERKRSSEKEAWRRFSEWDGTVPEGETEDDRA